MDERYFVFNGVDSREHGLRITSMPPRVMPARRYEEYTIPARSGKARIWDGAYESIQLPVGLYLPYEQGVTVSETPEIMRWLDGAGWLTLSDRPGRKFWATVYGQGSYDAWIEGMLERVSTIIFDADPHAYFVENDPVSVANGQFVQNPGNQTAEPVIEIAGSGEITLMIGQQISTLQLGDAGGLMTIAVPDGMIFLDGEICENGLEGDLPYLEPGANAVSWSGNVSAVSITVNARDIGW